MNQLIKFGKYFIFIAAFIFISLLFKPWELFYEVGVYKNLFKSMIYDGDFNIVNQVEPAHLWLVTKTYFFPINHPEIQSPFLIVPFLVEWISHAVSGSLFYDDFEFQLASLGLNLAAIISFYWFLKKICEELKIKLAEYDFPVIILGTPLFYFSVLQSTVLEVFALPFTAYLILNVIRMKKTNFNFSFFLSGCCAGILFISKITYLPAVIAFALVALLNLKKGLPLRKLALFVFAGLLFVVPHYFNRVSITGQTRFLYRPLGMMIANGWDFSAKNIFTNLGQGYLYYGGLFFSAPLYLVGIVGLYVLCKKLLSEKFINKFEFTLVFLWIAAVLFHQVPLPGYVTEDHLQGRIHMCLLPILILGMAYLKNHVFANYKKAIYSLSAFFVGWNFLIIFCYMCVAKVNPYLFHTKIFNETELISRGFEMYRLELHYNYLKMAPFYKEILIFSMLSAVFYFLVQHLKKQALTMASAVVLAAGFFIVMAVSNAFCSEPNIETMKEEKIYDKIVIGNGPDIYFLDYIVDYFNRMKAKNDPELQAKVRLMTHKVYVMIPSELLKSTPAFDKVLKDESLDFTAYLNDRVNNK
ncbi:MAG: hypothetical protein ACXVAX_08550 [Pseudobdellovibrio sp.]